MKDNEATINIVFLFLAMIIISAAVTFVNNHWKVLAINHNFAEYNQITGKWQWKTNVVITNFVTVTNIVNK